MNITEVTTSGFGNSPSDKRRLYPRMYFHLKEESILENFAKRAAGIRPSPKDYEKLIPEALNRLGLKTENVKATWSLRAGCSCPCSPGFILKSPNFYQDIHVTVTPETADVL